MSTPTPDLPDWTRTSAVIDSPQVLYDSGLNAPLPITSPVIDVSRFRSVRFALGIASGAGMVAGPLINQWGMPGGVTASDVYTTWPNNEITTFPVAPVIYDRVKGNTLQSTVKHSVSGSTAQLVIVGSLLDQPAPDSIWTADSSSEVLMAGNTGTMASGAKQDYYSGPYAGNLILNIEANGSSFEGFLTGEYGGAGAPVAVNLGVLTAASGGKASAVYTGGGLALDLTFYNSGSTSGNCSFSLVKYR